MEISPKIGDKKKKEGMFMKEEVNKITNDLNEDLLLILKSYQESNNEQKEILKNTILPILIQGIALQVLSIMLKEQ